MGLLDTFLAYKAANTPRNTRPRVSPAKVIDDGLLGGRIGNIPNQAQEIYQGLLDAPSQLKQLVGPGSAESVRNAYDNPQQANPQQWMDAGMELSGMAPLGGLVAHTVYHGSPHKFSKFDMSKIGENTGNTGWYAEGINFSKYIDDAKAYSGETGNIYKADVILKKPFVMNDSWEPGVNAKTFGSLAKLKGFTDDEINLLKEASSSKNPYTFEEVISNGISGTRVTEVLKQNGYDGVRVNRRDNYSKIRKDAEVIVFDDQLPRILEVNGQPTGLLSWADEAAQKIKKRQQ